MVVKQAIIIAGDKNSGKTMFALRKIISENTKALIFSYDMQTNPIISTFFQDYADKLKVIEPTAKMDYNLEKYTTSCSNVYDGILQTLKQINPGEFDYVVHDGLQILSEILEMKMRFVCGLDPFQGVANMGVWKFRKMYLRDIHQASYNNANKGVLYTTYIEYIDTVIKDGQVLERKKQPRWLDQLESHSNVVLYTYSEQSNNGLKFLAECAGSKIPDYQTGVIYDFTLPNPITPVGKRQLQQPKQPTHQYQPPAKSSGFDW